MHNLVLLLRLLHVNLLPKVIMEHNGQIIDVADPIQMMTSSASLGEHIIIKVSGNDEEDILLKLKEIIDSQL